MAQSLELNIKTTSDVPQAMDKAKAATVTFGKQVEDIQKKFSTGFKDIFLGFMAPMVLLQGAIGMISSAIEKSRQEIEAAKADAEKGENKYMRQGTITAAQELARRRQEALDRKNAELGAIEIAREQGKVGSGSDTEMSEAEKAMVAYVSDGQGFFDTAGRFLRTAAYQAGAADFAKNEEIQKILERNAAARVAASPEGKAAAEAAEAAKKAAEPKTAPFKAPEGFGNVIGVGANPVMEAMNAQLEEAKRQTELLTRIAASSPTTLPQDFTKTKTT